MGMSIRAAAPPEPAQAYMLVATSETGAVLTTMRAESLEAAFGILVGALTHAEEDPGMTADVIAEAWKDAQEMPEYFSVGRRYVRYGMVRL